ncbi:MAG: hypothetical protein HY000_25620 [Planctomycetes bacterium]|nr:hypothetical protein [Planctomycetota bacterium]
MFWREQAPNGEHVTHTVILDAGTAEGLLPGMRLEVTRPYGVKARVVVRKLSEHEAEAEVLQTPSNGRIKQATLAWRLKTSEW